MQLMRDMSTFEEEYRGKGVHILAVNVLEPREVGHARAEETGLPLDFAWISDDDRRALGIDMVPAQVLLDREGRVLWTSSFSTIAGGAPVIRAALDGALDGTLK